MRDMTVMKVLMAKLILAMFFYYVSIFRVRVNATPGDQRYGTLKDNGAHLLCIYDSLFRNSIPDTALLAQQ